MRLLTRGHGMEAALASTSAILHRGHLIQVRSSYAFFGHRGVHDG